MFCDFVDLRSRAADIELVLAGYLMSLQLLSPWHMCAHLAKFSRRIKKSSIDSWGCCLQSRNANLSARMLRFDRKYAWILSRFSSVEVGREMDSDRFKCIEHFGCKDGSLARQLDASAEL